MLQLAVWENHQTEEYCLLNMVRKDFHCAPALQKKRPVVIIKGGGVLGSSVFSLLTEHQHLDVMLLEASPRLGGGSTAKNHGRVHSAATGIFTDPKDVSIRKVQGNRILRTFSGIWDNKRPGIYRCARGVNGDAFKIACLNRGVDISDVDRSYAAENWLLKAHADGRAFSLPEFAFNPARLTLDLARLGRRRGGNILLGCQGNYVYRSNGRLAIKSANGHRLSADFIVNTASKYANTIQFEDREPLLDLAFYRWPVMLIPSRFVPPLDHVLVVNDGDGLFPSVIPHKEWVTFDCKTQAEEVNSPNLYPFPNPRPFDPEQSQELQIFNTTRRVFRPFASMSGQRFAERVRVFYGVHSRRRGEFAGSDICKMFGYDNVENYLVAHGGLATTSLLDACEIVEAVEMRLGLRSPKRAERLTHFVSALTRHQPDPGMIYEEQ